jgi:putative acetyltransferase
MLHWQKTDASNLDYKNLIVKLDAYLVITDEDEHEFYNQFNSSDAIKHVMVLLENQIAIGCGAIKKYENNTWEIKRMFIEPEARGKGLATQLLKQLEQWAVELGVKTLILETGKRQTEAIALYHKNAYQVIPNFGQYVGVANSVCFEKKLF